MEATSIANSAASRDITGFTNLGGVWINPSAIGFIIAVLGIVYALWRAHKSGEFSVWELVKNKTYWTLGIGAGAFLVTSWVMVDLQVKGKLDTTWLTLYGTMWVAPILATIFKGSSSTTAPDTPQASSKSP